MARTLRAAVDALAPDYEAITEARREAAALLEAELGRLADQAVASADNLTTPRLEIAA